MRPALQPGDMGLLARLLDTDATKIACWQITSSPEFSVIKDEQECADFFNRHPDGFLISSTSSPIRHPGIRQLKLYFINNPSGTVRWFFPANASYPSFLALYNSSGLKAKVYKLANRILFAMGLKSLLAKGSVEIWYLQKEPFKKYWQKLPDPDLYNFSIFTGTVGKNRKVIMEVNREHRTTHFVKIALYGRSGNAERLIMNEVDVLDHLAGQLHHTSIPRVVDRLQDNETGHFAILTSVKPAQQLPSVALCAQHMLSLGELYQHSAEQRPLSRLDFWTEIKQNIEFLKTSFRSSQFSTGDSTKNAAFKESPLAGVLSSILVYLEELLAKVQQNEQAIGQVPVARAHNDFTPWNMYLAKDRLYLYDWELSRPALPLLFDVFHFAFQTNILLGNKGFGAVKNAIEKVLLLPETQHLINIYRINVPLHYRLYLLSNISYYSCLYVVQPDLHIQSHWLMNTWKDALRSEAFLPFPQPEVSQRRQFIKQFLGCLAPLHYALLKYIEPSIATLKDSSDLDILIDRKDLPLLLQFTAAHPMVSFVHCNPKSYMAYLAIYFKDGSFLQVDLMYSFVRKTVVYMDAGEVLNNTQLNAEGLKVPSFAHQFEYVLLFYRLNHARVEEKYVSYFARLDHQAQQEIVSYFNRKFNGSSRTLSELYEAPGSRFAPISRSRQNSGLGSLINRINYVSDTFKDMFNRKGKVITFSGVDGAGKSTVLFKVKELIEKKYRQKVVVLRHRPSVLPILSAYKYGKAEAEKRTTERLPRTGTNKSMLSSLFRFGYYYTDYVFGQWVVWAKHTLRGHIVLYDRYYFDFIADARRSNIHLNPGLISSLYTFVFKPDLNFFLYAPSEVILQRKQEMNKAEIEKLTLDYLALFKKLGAKSNREKYLPIENIHLDHTMEIIESQWTKVMKK